MGPLKKYNSMNSIFRNPRIFHTFAVVNLYAAGHHYYGKQIMIHAIDAAIEHLSYRGMNGKN